MQIPTPNQPPVPLDQDIKDFSLQPGPVKNEDAAVALVVQDTARAERFILQRLWMSEWRVAKALYEAPVRQEYWRDTLVPRASNSYPLSAQHVRAILDQVMPALFPEEPPFSTAPNPDIPRQAARAWETIISDELKFIKFKQQMRLVAKDGLIFGTGLGKWGWQKLTKRTTRYQRAQKPVVIEGPGGEKIYVHTAESDEFKEILIDQTISRPFFSRVEINHLLVAPGLRVPDVSQAQYVVYRDYLTIRDLNNLREFEGYNIPSEN